MDQQALFIPTAHGERIADALETRLHSRRTDPVSSVAAVPAPERLNDEEEWAWALLDRFGPGTTKEIARQAFGTPYGHGQSESDIHHMLGRRCCDLERMSPSRANCGRIKDESGKTVWADFKRCDVTGRKSLVWRALR